MSPSFAAGGGRRQAVSRFLAGGGLIILLLLVIVVGMGLIQPRFLNVSITRGAAVIAT